MSIKLNIIGMTAVFASMIATHSVEAQKLAVINTDGEVWARDITDTTVGGGTKLDGPGLFGATDDRYVLGSLNEIAVVTDSGRFWPRTVTDDSVSSGVSTSGELFGGPDHKYLLENRCNEIFVVNAAGEVWVHERTDRGVSDGVRLDGPSLFGGDNDKYVLLDEVVSDRILVINNDGEVWAHDLAPRRFGGCSDTAVGAGYKLDGSSLFGAPDDRYVVLVNDAIDVVNNAGEVWRHPLTKTEVAGGTKLDGPSLFGGDNDKYLVVYDVDSSSHR